VLTPNREILDADIIVDAVLCDLKQEYRTLVQQTNTRSSLSQLLGSAISAPMTCAGKG